MELNDFFSTVERHSDLRGLSIEMPQEKKDGCFAIEHISSKLVTVLPVEAVTKAEWTMLEDVLTCKRDPQVLYHMTRVVGYYSRIENWNKSKIGELADRHVGSYVLEEVEN